MTFVTLTMGRPCCFLEVQKENVEEIAAFCVIHVFYCVTCANGNVSYVSRAFVFDPGPQITLIVIIKRRNFSFPKLFHSSS